MIGAVALSDATGWTRSQQQRTSRELGLIGEENLDLAVESTRAEEGWIEHLGSVGRSHDHHPGTGVETVHLGQELVQRLLTLVIGDNRTAAALGNGVDLVDEDDRRRSLACIGEGVPDPGRTDSDEQLDETRTGQSQERYPGLSGDREGQECLTRARGTHHQHAAGPDSAGMGKPVLCIEAIRERGGSNGAHDPAPHRDSQAGAAQ